MEAIQFLDSAFRLLTVLAALFAIIYTCGVVWRVERRLDISYKFFLAAIIFFTLANALNYFDVGKSVILPLSVDLSYALFSLLFLVGILTMRSLIRKIDGE